MADGAVFGRLRASLMNSWATIARPEQRTPPGEWRVWVISAGRGFGKTRAGSECVLEYVRSAAARRIALIGATAADTRDVMVEGPSGVLTVSPDGMRPTYEPSKRRLTWPNGAVATLFSAEEADRLRGPEHDTLWADELCAWGDPGAWDMAMFGLRRGHARAIVTTTPKPTKLLRSLLAREGQDVVVTRGRTRDNAANLSPEFLRTIEAKYGGTRLGRQELDGELLVDTPGALWTLDMIERLRRTVEQRPTMKRVVVGIDPAVSAGEDADETGLIVAGLGLDDHVYILEDASARCLPIEWARKAVALYNAHRADRVVAEINNGGALVENTIRTVDPRVSYRGVHASRGKITRAEPVSALYEQGKVHHVGVFDELEAQMTTFTPGSKDSPDRLDALVHAITDLAVIPGCPVAATGYMYGRGGIYKVDEGCDYVPDWVGHLPFAPEDHRWKIIRAKAEPEQWDLMQLERLAKWNERNEPPRVF